MFYPEIREDSGGVTRKYSAFAVVQIIVPVQ